LLVTGLLVAGRWLFWMDEWMVYIFFVLLDASVCFLDPPLPLPGGDERTKYKIWNKECKIC